LKAKIDERQLRHWQQAAAVREGRQDLADPDAEHLVRCKDGVREYEPHPGRRYVKQLVDGRWEIAPSLRVADRLQVAPDAGT
jgi:hypothetical protein